MAATTESVTQPHQSQPSPKNIQKTFWTDNQGDAQLDALAALNDCSQGALLRSLVEETYTEAFDDLDPAHIEQGQVSVDDLQALANDEITVDELDLTSITTESVTEYEPDSYYLTVTPDDLAEPGPELDWETLRDAVENPEDGGYWNDELEIHESRVGDTTLKASHRPAARILTGVARSKAYENGIVPHDMIEDLVNEYCLHLTNRLTDGEQERGKVHIRETYTNLIANQLYENPSPVANSYYTTKTNLHARLQAEIDMAQRVANRAETVTDFDAWQQTQGCAFDDENLRQQWHSELTTWLEDIARAKHAGRTYAIELRRDNYDNADNEGETAFDGLHANIHDALEAFDTLPAEVRVDCIEALEDRLLAVIGE
ncbi:hypothetical protein [Haladaptatus sp. AB643]|uniref:hypothetical protein n=1 Tax=Haladaptatus sp. AB643 TaxID=2934174 RepID=UPI00209C16E9|nr:hypothetical protein [Haladaptatus sp. AB643]MCO8245343.1 hypothetical protein [Haladaptatus sp. AB643]